MDPLIRTLYRLYRIYDRDFYTMRMAYSGIMDKNCTNSIGISAANVLAFINKYISMSIHQHVKYIIYKNEWKVY